MFINLTYRGMVFTFTAAELVYFRELGPEAFRAYLHGWLRGRMAS